MPAFSYLLVLVIALSTTFTTLAAADTPQQAFAKSWQGKTVIVKRSLYTLVYNERGRLGNTRDGKRDGLIVLTPSQGGYFQFDGRQGREDVVERDPKRIFDAVNLMYAPDTLEVRSYRKVEPVIVSRYDSGWELRVQQVRVDVDTVNLTFSIPSGPEASEDVVTSLRVKWPIPFSKSFSERDGVESLIRQFVDTQ